MKGLRVVARAGLPEGPWAGTLILGFRRSAWFADDSGGLLGLMASGISPSPRGLGLAGPVPVLSRGTRLHHDTRWFLEGWGPLEGVEEALDRRVPLGSSSGPPGGWVDRWSLWLDAGLPTTPEGDSLRALIRGPGPHWETLVGRGSGSTPWGDDYLAGWMGARMVLGTVDPDDPRRLVDALPRTSALSRHFLTQLVQGWVDSDLGQVLAGLWPEPHSAAARSLASHGDLSGLATWVGVVAGVQSGVVV